MKKTAKEQFSIFNIMEETATNGQSVPKTEEKIVRRARRIKKAKKHEPEIMPTTSPTVPPAGKLDQIFQNLVSGLKKYFTDNHFTKAVLGVSGGVDSALTLLIAVEALGAENVTALIMPELGLSNPENIEHAKILCDFLKVKYHYQPINPFLVDFRSLPWKQNRLAQMNTRARVRAVLLYNFANTENALVLGTSNKSELLLGYGTKYGDLAADVEVIAELYKTEVVELAAHVGLPLEIVNKTPTAELSHGQTDEGELGASYKEMDQVLMKLDLGIGGCIGHGMPAGLVQMVFRKVKENKHKTEIPYTIKSEARNPKFEINSNI